MEQPQNFRSETYDMKQVTHILRTSVQNLVARATWPPWLVHPCCT